MCSVLNLIATVIQIFIYLVIIRVVMSWLIAFNVINIRNQFVAGVADFLARLTDPVLRPIRSVVPTIGGIDISPVILILGLILIQNLIFEYGSGACFYGFR